MARPKKTSRVTPKGTKSTPPAAEAEGVIVPTEAQLSEGSPPWVPALMFGGLGLGVVLIFVNYLILSDPSNWWLLGGLLLVLVGIVAATRYQ